MKGLLFSLLVLSCLFFYPRVSSAQQPSQPDYFNAKVTTINVQTKSLKVEVTEGKLQGKQFQINLYDEKQQINNGEEVIISYQKDPSGRELVYIVDRMRLKPLMLLFAVFIIIVIAVGKLKGALSFLGMMFSFLIIGQLIVPQIIIGSNPIVIALLGSLFIIPVSFYISHGIKRTTTVAVISTFLALFLTGILAYLFVFLTKLTGFAAEEAVFIQSFTRGTIDIRNLLLAGIIIGAMGVLDDITISQTSIVEKLSQANPKFSFGQLFTHAMDVGKDHIASLVNTLVLVYAGAALPLFLVFSNSSLSYTQAINQEIIATEIVRTLVSSIGIIAAVPITTFLATWTVKKYR